MAALTLAEVARMTGAAVLQGPPGLTFGSYGIDSRLTGAGELFFAVPGRRDGHDFVAAAAAAGAAGAVVSRPVEPPVPGFGLLLVPDTVAALQDLARGVLALHPVKIVGVTGSVGKTTTKEFAAALLAARFRVLKSEGNFNNRLGLALSVLRVEAGHDAAVLEMGMSAPGEIRELTRVAPPDVAVVTNIAPVHLEFFRDLDGIARAKKEILDGARPGATAVLNADDPRVMGIAADFRGRRVTFGLAPGADVRAASVAPRGYAGYEIDLRYGNEQGFLPFSFLNRAAVADLLAAAAVSLALGLRLAEIVPVAAALRPSPRRGLLVEAPGGVRVYDDAYNSSPRALEAALTGLAGLPARRRVAVLGDMLELGQGGPDFHRAAGETVARTGWDLLVAVGPLAAAMAEGALAAGLGAAAILRFADAPSAAAAVAGLVRDGDLVLVKGSRGMRMETVVEALRAGGKE